MTDLLTPPSEAERSGLARRDVLPVVVTLAVLLAWSLFSYLTVRVDSDIVAEALQVQSWLHHPFWVLSYPGQLYGGVLEYPLEFLGQWIAPGDVYSWTLIRVAYVPIIGLLVCINVRRLSPDGSLWPVALAAAAGPAVLHGFMAIKDLYPFGWLVAMGGATILFAQFARTTRPWLIVVGAVLVGLGVYQHPTTALFSVPLVLAGIVHWGVRGRRLVLVGIGFVAGLVPLVIAQKLQPDMVVAWESAHLGMPQPLAALGLSTASDAWATAVVPTGWGVQFTDINSLALPASVQFAVNALLALLLVASLVLAVPVVVGYARGRAAPSHAFLVVLWGSVLVTLVGLTAVVKPVFFYGAALGFLVWITLGALPSVLPRTPRLVVVAVVLVAMAATSWGSVLAVKPRFPASIAFKADQAQVVRDVAASIADAGIPYVYGSYWEALPIAFASEGAVHPLNLGTNRFPLPPGTPDDARIIVAVLSGGTALPIGLDQWPDAAAALARAQALCTPLPDLTAQLPGGIRAMDCPAALMDPAVPG